MTDGVLTEAVDGPPQEGKTARRGVLRLALPQPGGGGRGLDRGTWKLHAGLQAPAGDTLSAPLQLFLGATKSLKNRAAAGKVHAVPSQCGAGTLVGTGGNVSKTYTTQFTLAARRRPDFYMPWTFGAVGDDGRGRKATCWYEERPTCKDGALASLL
uniref:Uncharacterized protein n=1 Tax=Knipowitschia caucasica TaxID=637954 RepID=A0AAV2LVB3_KNICA